MHRSILTSLRGNLIKYFQIIKLMVLYKTFCLNEINLFWSLKNIN